MVIEFGLRRHITQTQSILKDDRNHRAAQAQWKEFLKQKTLLITILLK